MKTLLALTSRVFRKNQVRVFYREIGDSTPEGVAIDGHRKIISCTRAALSRLGDWCADTARALGLTLMVAGSANNALAQDKPTGSSKNGTVSVTLVPNTPADAKKLDEALKGGVAGGTVAKVASNPSNSAKAALDKKGMTIVIYKDKDGNQKELTFNDISKLSPEEKKDVLAGLKRSERSAFNEFEIEMANQEVDQIAKLKGEANQQYEQELLKIEGSIRTLLTSGQKISPKVKTILEKAISYGKPPDTIKYFEDVLRNPQNFA